MLEPRSLYARIPLFDRTYYLHQLPRLVEALHYDARMKAAGVPDKVRRKILRRWTSPFCYALRKEIRGVIADMQRRA